MAFIQISPPEEEKKGYIEDTEFDTEEINKLKNEKIDIKNLGNQHGPKCGAFALAAIIVSMSLNPKEKDIEIIYNPTDQKSTEREGRILSKNNRIRKTPSEEVDFIYKLTGNITLNSSNDEAIYITNKNQNGLNSVSGLIDVALKTGYLEVDVYVIEGFEKWLFQKYPIFQNLYQKEKKFLEENLKVKITEKKGYKLPPKGASHLIWVKATDDNNTLPGHWVAMGGNGAIFDSAASGSRKKLWDLEKSTEAPWDINQSPPQLAMPSNKNNNRALIFSNLWIEFRYKNQALAKSLALELGSELILLNGEKVIFDKPVPTTPVTLEPKPTHRRAYTNGNGYRPY
ncbi:MAG: hypothetical protein F6K36_13580 [Symploca sp. SIO3C6]|nr:hypothetical protein [Symploca sp. SIO3C6]